MDSPPKRAAALIIQVASLYGIPLSTTHVISTSIMGVGAMKRFSGVKWTRGRANRLGLDLYPAGDRMIGYLAERDLFVTGFDLDPLVARARIGRRPGQLACRQTPSSKSGCGRMRPFDFTAARKSSSTRQSPRQIRWNFDRRCRRVLAHLSALRSRPNRNRK